VAGQVPARRKGPRGQKRTDSRPQEKAVPAQEKKPVIIQETVTVQELAEKMRVSAAEVIKKLMAMGIMAAINNEIDADTATLVAGEFGLQVEVKPAVDPEAILQAPEVDPDKQQLRPCVVTVMGHVDHGKTSLLDSIRETKVTASEAGGITQHIGAYQVEYENKWITFVDTPGHEAFTAMRARGAKVTDIAVLVVAADDGVMPQTVEAINHAKAAEVPIIVAINKMDKPEANPDRIKRELTEHNLVVEDWGGDTICVEVSAKARTGLNELLEMILLVAEMGELKANPDQNARGTVVEAELDKGRGPVATVLVQNGTLRIGDMIIAGVALGRVRAMVDHTGRRVKKASPSMPVEVLGFSEVPPAGELFYAVQDEKMARTIVARRQVKKREEDLRSTAPRVSLDDLFKHIQEGQIKELRVIIKSDVQGSTEALKQSLERLGTDEVKVNIIHGGVGAVTESDIMLASASNAIIIGFNVRPDVNARRAAEAEKVDIRLYRVIYDAIEDVKAAMSGLLDPEYREVVLGRAEIRQIFKVSKVGTIAGCYVVDGKIIRDAGVRVIRDGIVVHEGKLDSLKRFKDDAKEVVQGYECGLTLEKYNELREGDIVEAFTVEAIKRELA
jgi:translation initiation factor IF-2